MLKKKFLLIITISLFYMSCMTYVRVNVDVSSTLDTSVKPEITQSETFDLYKDEIKNVVLSLPSKSYIYSVSDSKGAGTPEILSVSYTHLTLPTTPYV